MRGLWFVAFLVAYVSCEVEVLTDNNFDKFLTENELVLVEFYAPWCGHCKRLEPEFDKASEELAGTGAVLAKVDATVETELGTRFNIEGFPTLKLFRAGVPSAYEGGRTAKDIVAYLKKQTGPALKPLTSADQLQALIPPEESGGDPVVVAFAAEDSEIAKFINQYAVKFRDDYTFGIVSDAAVAGDNAMGTIALFKPFDELKNVFTGELTEEAFSDFLRAYSTRAVDEIGPGNYGNYVKRGLPIAWLFLNLQDAEVTQTVLAEYRKVAVDFKQKFSLVYLNGVQYKQMASKLGLTGEVMPGLAVEKNEEHFAFPEDQKLNEASMKEWLQDCLDGKLQPTFKSEPVPDSLFDENNVATVVGDNFKEVVLDDSKDVFLELYAPWCGHCKQLVPTWNSLGKALKGVPSVVIAKTDATANDYPAGFSVKGFPTIQLVTSKHNSIIKYDGDRTVEAMLDWLKENVATPFQFPQEGAGVNDEL